MLIWCRRCRHHDQAGVQCKVNSFSNYKSLVSAVICCKFQMNYYHICQKLKFQCNYLTKIEIHHKFTPSLYFEKIQLFGTWTLTFPEPIQMSFIFGTYQTMLQIVIPSPRKCPKYLQTKYCSVSSQFTNILQNKTHSLITIQKISHTSI